MPSNTFRIVKNTLMLYFRQILIILVNLYTVRVTLAALGAEDYGIFNVAAGITAMFSFLSGSMAAASQRYFSFEIGRDNREGLIKTFSLTMAIYVLISVVFFIVSETAGVWMVRNKLIIPADRLNAAFWIYQCSILSFILTMITTPYKAAIIAHENMNLYAAVSIAEASLKLITAYALRIIFFDKLTLYGMLLLAVAFIVTGIYRHISAGKYAECRFRLCWDFPLFWEMARYIGWNLFGSLADVLKYQGVNILLNLFFGPLVNAARALSRQVDATIRNFALNFSTAAKPQIIKYYAAGNRSKLLPLVFQVSKGASFLLFFFILPIELELPFLFKLWLKETPGYVLEFTRLLLANTLIDSISFPLNSLSQATGKTKWYQTISGGITLLNLPVTFAALKAGYSPVSIHYIGIGLSVVVLAVRIIILSRQLDFSAWRYTKAVALPVILVVGVSSIIPVCLVLFCSPGIIRLILTTIISSLSVLGSIFLLGFTGQERKLIMGKIKTYFPKIKGRS
jgi:O-antigen/teichoic acid export membrane protein